jgi:hypothetical protein
MSGFSPWCSFRRHKPGRKFIPACESLEDRTLLAAGAFLQGTAFIDANQDGKLDPGDPHLPGVTISLYQGTTVSPATLLATTVTDANGNYLFSDANVPMSFGSPGLNPGTYSLVETPPTGFVNDATQVLSQLNPATSVNASTIQVTLLDPANIFISFNSTEFFQRGAWDFLQQTLNGVTHKESAGQLPVTPVNPADLTLVTSSAGVTNKSDVVTLSNTAGLAVGDAVLVTDGVTNLYSVVSSITPNTSITLADKWTGATGNAASVSTLGVLNSPFLTQCWDLHNFLADGTNVFQVIPASGASLPANAGRIAYLYNHYGTVDISTLSGIDPNTGLPRGTSAEAVGLQVAIWELKFGSNFTNLLELSKQNDTNPAVVAKELSDVITWANFYVNNSVGQNETATFLQVVDSPLQGGQQGILATDSFDFGNVPQGGHKTTPAIVTVPGQDVVLGSGQPLTDTAFLSDGDSPTGTITFTLRAPDGITVVDTEMVNVNGNGSYTTPNGFVPLVAGTYEWVAVYGGDQNNNAVVSNFGDEPETVLRTSPAITTNTGGAVTLGSGQPLTDSATLTGGVSPTGTITFTLTGPDNITVVDTEVVTVNGNGTYTTSHGFVPTLAGTYQWVATYSGDTNNSPMASRFGDEPEIVIRIPNFDGKILLLGSAWTSGLSQDKLVAFTLYVNGLYQKLLNRAPDQAGVNAWVFQLSAGVAPARVADSIYASPEHRGIQVDSYFQSFLGRSPSSAERASWVSLFLAGASETTVQQDLLLSPEFQALHPGNAGLVSGLFSVVLGRAAGQAEQAGLVQALQQGLSPSTLISAILNSPEYLSRVIDQDFALFLHRAPSPLEIANWVSLLRSGAVTTDTVAEMLLASPEFFTNPI